MPSLEMPPAANDRTSERRWTRISLSVLVLALVAAGLAIHHLHQAGPAPVAAVDHRPLPASVRAETLRLLEPYLVEVAFSDQLQGQIREFHIKGRTRAGLAQEFYAGFRPVLANQVMPLLRPYGEIISFDVASLDLPPARLRPLPSKD